MASDLGPLTPGPNLFKEIVENPTLHVEDETVSGDSEEVGAESGFDFGYDDDGHESEWRIPAHSFEMDEAVDLDAPALRDLIAVESVVATSNDTQATDGVFGEEFEKDEVDWDNV
jgi:hypothetical protein